MEPVSWTPAEAFGTIVAVNVIDLLLSMAIWGSSTTVRLAG